jgi:hypothetical protein
MRRLTLFVLPSEGGGDETQTCWESASLRWCHFRTGPNVSTYYCMEEKEGPEDDDDMDVDNGNDDDDEVDL